MESGGVVRLPINEQKALAGAELVESVNAALVAIQQAQQTLSLAQENIRTRFAVLREKCPEVVATWRGPMTEPRSADDDFSHSEFDEMPVAGI